MSRTRKKKLVVVSTCTIILLLLASAGVLLHLRGCGKKDHPAAVDTKETDKVVALFEEIDSIVGVLEAMPSWYDVQADDGEKRAEIEQSVEEIAGHSTDVIRAAILVYARRTSPRDLEFIPYQRAKAKMFVLNGYLFNLPETVLHESPHLKFNDGWAGDCPVSWQWQWGKELPKPWDRMWMRWPWAETEDGSWRLWGTCEGFGQFQPGAFLQFDYYRKTFGKRDINRPRSRVVGIAGSKGGEPGDSESVNRIASLLEAMPKWNKDTMGLYRERRAIEVMASKMAEYSLDTARAGMAAFLAKRQGNASDAFEAEKSVFLLTKYLFDFPETVYRSSSHVAYEMTLTGDRPISGDPGKPKDTDLVWMRWPWAEGADGRWHLYGEPEDTFEPQCGALDTFDYYRRTFGKRDVSKRRRRPEDRKP